MRASDAATVPLVVVDASVMFKWFLPDGEAAVPAALALLEDHELSRIVLTAPEHGLLEVVNALLHRGFDAPRLADAARLLLAARIEWAPLAPLLEDAAKIASAKGLTLYDAAYAALASQLDSELITADRRLAGCGACRTRLL